MVHRGGEKPFLVIEDDEEEGLCRVVRASSQEEIEEGVVLARTETEETGWLLAAALPVALLRDDPWVMTVAWSDFELRIRDVVRSGVKLETVGVHGVQDVVNTVVSLTRTPESLLALLRGAPRDVLEEALRRLRETDPGESDGS